MPTIKTFLSAVGKRPILFGSLLLAALTILNNWPVSYFDFAWDDFGYVVNNYPIQDPVSFKTAWWCLTQFAEANWHPITWFALNIQFNCFGLDPRGYHIVNLALHVANVVLLYAVLCRMTGAAGKSLIAAALFAVHPVHVESVAWISEIKDVFSTFFLLLTLHAYTSYAKRPTFSRYALSFCALALGLMAKPMLVTAPFALLLLDYWPLGRWTKGPQPARQEYAPPRYAAGRLLLEKLPFLALAVGTCVLTFLAQREGGAVAGLDALPLSMRLANVLNSYVIYMWRMVWPWPLSFFYPLTPQLPIWRIAGCVMVLAATTAICLRLRRTKPYMVMGWLWFTGTLVPVIGIVQVGSQGLADRYTYIPSIGLLMATVWLAADLAKRLRISRLLPTVVAVALVFVYMMVSFEYLGHWQNETELYKYAITIDDRNAVAHNNYGSILARRGDIDGAMRNYQAVLTYSPEAAMVRINLAKLQLMDGEEEEAEKNIRTAWENKPNLPQIYFVQATLRAQQSNFDAAEKLLRQAAILDPKDIVTLNTLAAVLMQRHKFDEALTVYETALANAFDKDPRKAFINNNIGEYWMRLRQWDKASEAFTRALTLQPQFTLASRNLARAHLACGDTEAAEAQLRKTLTLARDSVSMMLLGDLRLARKQYGRAYVWYRRTLAYGPDLPEAHEGMATVLRALGRPDDAGLHAARALDIRVLLRPSPSADKAKAAAEKAKRMGAPAETDQTKVHAPKS